MRDEQDFLVGNGFSVCTTRQKRQHIAQDVVKAPKSVDEIIPDKQKKFEREYHLVTGTFVNVRMVGNLMALFISYRSFRKEFRRS